MSINEDLELSPEARSLLVNLRSTNGSIRGDITKDKVMWLYWIARPGETVDAATFKELYKRRLIEPKGELESGEKYYKLSDAGRR